MSQRRDSSEPVKDETLFIDWNGYRYDLYTYPAKEGYGIERKLCTIQSYIGAEEGVLNNNKILLKTIARMRLCATNETGAGIDTIPSSVLLQVKEVRLRKNSSSVYYAKVESVDGKYKGWVSLGSSHYDLYIRGVRIANEWKDENELYQTWTHPAYITEDMIFDKNGVIYNF